MSRDASGATGEIDGESATGQAAAGRTFPVDAVVVLGYALVVGGLVVSNPPALAPLRAALGIPFALFLPGYALCSALFPARSTPVTGRGRSVWRRPARAGGLHWIERVALSFGISLALLPVLGLALALAGLGFAPTVVAAALGGVVVLGTVVGTVRRARLPGKERYRVPYRSWAGEARAAVFGVGGVDAGLNLALAVLVVLSVGALGYALVAPPAAESYSGFQLLAEGEGGDLVAGNYPREFAPGEARPIYVGIDNHEGSTTSYTVVAELQRVETVDGDVSVVERERVDRFTVTLDPGERLRERRTVAPDTTGEDLRLVYYLYRGDAPADPDRSSAYRSVYLWVEVGNAGGEGDVLAVSEGT